MRPAGSFSAGCRAWVIAASLFCDPNGCSKRQPNKAAGSGTTGAYVVRVCEEGPRPTTRLGGCSFAFPSKLVCFPSLGRAPMLVYVRPLNEVLLRARVPGAQDQHGYPPNPSHRARSASKKGAWPFPLILLRLRIARTPSRSCALRFHRHIHEGRHTIRPFLIRHPQLEPIGPFLGHEAIKICGRAGNGYALRQPRCVSSSSLLAQAGPVATPW